MAAHHLGGSEVISEGSMKSISRYNPEGLGAPLGQYSHVTRVKSAELLFIAGQLPKVETFSSNVMAYSVRSPRPCVLPKRTGIASFNSRLMSSILN